MEGIRAKILSQEGWFWALEVFFYLLVVASGVIWAFMEVRAPKFTNYFSCPVFLVLNVAMICSVIRMRFLVKRHPDMFPDEQLALVHLALFTLTTTLWIMSQVYKYRHTIATNNFLEGGHTTELNVTLLISYNRFARTSIVYYASYNLLTLYMLYMLHSFSVFKGTKYDPVTKQHVPVLSLFQNKATLEKAMKDRVLTHKKRAAIQKALDYEEAMEMFKVSEVEASIVVNFVGNDLRGASMTSLRRVDSFAEARLSTYSNEEPDVEEMEGDELQRALKGDFSSENSSELSY